jgi:hypothetical protein
MPGVKTGRGNTRRVGPSLAKPRKAKAQQSLALTPETVERYAQQYVDEKLMAESAAARVKKMNENLKAYVLASGIVDEKLHRWADAGATGQLKLERRASKSLNEEAARAWLKKVGRTKEVIRKVWIEEFDEDAFYGLCHELGLSNEDVEKFETMNEVFALKVV